MGDLEDAGGCLAVVVIAVIIHFLLKSINSLAFEAVLSILFLIIGVTVIAYNCDKK